MIVVIGVAMALLAIGFFGGVLYMKARRARDQFYYDAGLKAYRHYYGPTHGAGGSY
jgi:hypothetical protein